MITTKNIVVLVLLSGITFFVSNNLLEGTLKNNINLGGELKSPPDSLYQWNIGAEAPFKYRMLHRSIVLGTYNVFVSGEDNNLLFFRIYKSYAFLFHTAAIILFYFLVGHVGLPRYRMAGAMLFALLPPMSMAYNVPVHTREDTLAYSLLFLGLVAILKDKPLYVFVISLLGVLCRETLLILPFVYLFFGYTKNIYIRLAVAALSFCVFLSLRLFMGITPYDHAEGFRWNLSHPDQVVGFIFISFGFLWIPFLLEVIRKKETTTQLNSARLFYRSAVVAVSLIFITTFLGGIFNEIRLLYLLAPWVIIITLYGFQRKQQQIHNTFLQPKFILFVAISTLSMIIVTTLLLRNHDAFLPASRYGISYPKWIVATCVQLLLTTIATSLLWRNRKY